MDTATEERLVRLVAAALSGLCGNPDRAGDPEEYARDAVAIGKAAARELAKTTATLSTTQEN